MSMIAYSIVDFGDDTHALKQYLETHVPDAVAKLGGTAYHATQAEENIFPEMASIDGQCVTRYELPKGTDANEIASQILPKSGWVPPNATIEIRIYENEQTWYGQDWCGRVRDIQAFQMAFWQTSDAVHKDFAEWIEQNFQPEVLDNPMIIRGGISKLKHMSISRNGKTEVKNIDSVYQYLGVWEFDRDEVPWDALVYLGTSEKWRLYWESGQVVWLVGSYHVDRVYPEEKRNDSPATR